MANDATRKNEVGRREFIGTAARGAAAVGGVMFIPTARVWGSAANSQVRVGLLGCGRVPHVSLSYVGILIFVSRR
jgi:hypothetical protein